MNNVGIHSVKKKGGCMARLCCKKKVNSSTHPLRAFVDRDEKLIYKVKLSSVLN